nr:hypothetical protein [Tanacetum cinerariifolium]
LIIAALRDELRKLNGKAIVDNTVTTHTIDLEMLKVDVEPIAPRLLNNKTVHSDYLRLTQVHASILKEVVEQGKSLNPLNNSLDHTFNLKSVEVVDLNASLQEKVLVITALKEQLKGKAVLSKAVSLNPLDPALLQVDVV